MSYKHNVYNMLTRKYKVPLALSHIRRCKSMAKYQYVRERQFSAITITHTFTPR